MSATTTYPTLMVTLAEDIEAVDFFYWLDNENGDGTLDALWGLDSFAVYVNGELTEQAADSITASAGDIVEIAMTGGQSCFPVFHLYYGDTGELTDYGMTAEEYIAWMEEEDGSVTWEGKVTEDQLSYAYRAQDVYEDGTSIPVLSIDEALPVLGATPDEPLTSFTVSGAYVSPFAYCGTLESVCEGLLASNTQLTEAGTGLIIDDEAETVTEVMAGLFFCCYALAEAPEGLFAANTAVTDFYGCFCYCTSLTSVPEGLFAANTAVTGFYGCFGGCTALTSVPEGLFAANTAVTGFSWCFFYCTALTSVPEGLFAANTAVTDFSWCFYCTALTSVPEGLFAANTAVTDFSRCFFYCTALTSLTLYIGSPAVTSADYLFWSSDNTAYVIEGSVTEEAIAAADADDSSITVTILYWDGDASIFFPDGSASSKLISLANLKRYHAKLIAIIDALDERITALGG